MAFSPISLAINEILLTNYVTDIATISNANSLILKDKIEDIVNTLEIDPIAISIGTDNPINYIKTKSLILQDTGIIFQKTGPTATIASLVKNSSGESVFNIDNLNVNIATVMDAVEANSITVNDTATIDAAVTVNGVANFNNAVIESKETVVLDLTKASSTEAAATLTLTNTSKQNILVKLKATTAPTLNPVYDGSAISTGITEITLNIDFDATNPPAENTKFTITIVDVVNEAQTFSIISAITTAQLPVLLIGGTNQSNSGSITIYNGSDNVGINPASTIFGNNQIVEYGNTVNLFYIKDASADDRLLVQGLVGMEIF
jgi:hypothetical protein